MTLDGIKAIQAQAKQRIERKYDEKTGELRSVSIFRDVDGDGREDLYKVTTYHKHYDGILWERTVIDNDGDGYSDYQKDTDYSADGKKLEEKEYFEEDINDVKKRPHLEHEIYNRQMRVHLDGGYMYMKAIDASDNQ